MYGLIGYPLGHSLSPQLFEAAFPGRRYDLLEYESFGEAVSVFRAGYRAVNVTAPFKEEAFRVADVRDDVCARIGAANILVNDGGLIRAFNSDYDAVRELLEGIFALCPSRRVLVVGAGGAGKAAAVAAVDCGCEVFVANRTFSRAEEFCRRCGGMTPLALDDDISSFDIVVYTLPAKVSLTGLRGDAFFIEANYRDPSFADFISEGRYLGGERWLRAQAKAGFERMALYMEKKL